jgi:hypothetical protein
MAYLIQIKFPYMGVDFFSSGKILLASAKEKNTIYSQFLIF